MRLQCFLMACLIFSLNALAQRDNTANLGDKLDRNTIPAEFELRVEEIPNRPDSTDQNNIPARSEERMREEQVEPVEIEPEYDLITPSDDSE